MPKKRNTYGVVPRTPYANPGWPALSFGNPGLSKEQLVPSCVVITFKIADTFIEMLV